MKRALFLILILICFAGYSQDRVSFLTDSLQKELGVAKTDSARGHICLSLTSNSSYDFALYEKYAKKAIAHCTKSNYRFGKAKGHLFYGYALIRRGAIDSSFKQYYLAEKIFEEIKDTVNLASVYIQIAGNFAYQGDFSKAITYQEKTIELAGAKNDINELASGYNMLATSYGRLGDYDKALTHCLIGLDYAEKANDKEQIATSYTTIASIYGFTNKVKKALEYELKSLKVYEEIGQNFNITISLENIASHYLNLDQPKVAIQYLEKGLKIAMEGNDPESTSSINSRLGQAWRALGEYDKAFDFLKSAEKIYLEIGFEELIANLNFELGLTQLKRKKYGSALIYLNKSEKYAIKTGSIFDQEQIFKAKSELFELTGDYKNALLFKGKASSAKDSFLNIETEKAMAEMKTKYETEKKDLAINALENEAKVKAQKARQKNWIIIGSFILLFLTAIVGLLTLRQYKLNQKLKMEKFRNKVASDLHDDVGSTLSSISMYSEVIKQKAKDKIPETVPMLDNMATSSQEIMDAMSDIIWTINPKNNSLQSLIGRIKNWAAELCEAKDIKFDFSGKSDDIKLNMEASQNIYLVLKEAVNNALKYSNCTILSLSIKTESTVFSFVIEDNGKGFDKDNGSNGNGMRTMRERMAEVGGELNIDTSPSGTKIIASCPKK